MKRYLVHVLAILTCLVLITAFGNVAVAQVLTINDGVTLTVKSGTTLDVNCQEIIVNTGGTLDLQLGGILQDKSTITIDGTFTNDGTINNCSGNSFPVVTSGQNFDVSETSSNGTSVGTVAATDEDVPTTFSNWTITDGNIDNIFSINTNTGEITVTDNTKLDYSKRTIYTLAITVSDGIDTSGAKDVIINVIKANTVPLLDLVGNKTVNELTLLTFTASATDTDVPTNTLSYSLTGEPAGAAIDPNTGIFTWTPTEAQGPGTYSFDVVVTDDGTPNLNDSETIQVTVNEMNVAPVIANPGNQANGESDVINLFISATDNDLPVNAFTWSATGLPPNLSIKTGTGEIYGTIDATAKSGSPYSVTVTVKDNGVPQKSDSINFSWTITDTNRAPVLDLVGNKTVNELAQLSFTATASDTDLPANSLTFSLSGEPTGASINPSSGLFTWTPTEAQGPKTHLFAIVVTDNGSPNMNDSETIQVTVNEVNVAPVLANPGNQINGESDVVSLFINATDNDRPVNTLTWSASGLPNGLTINTGTGEIAGTINPSAVPGSPFTVNVSLQDNGTPPLSATNVSFTWTVTNTNHSPVLNPVGNKSINEKTLLTFTASATDTDTPGDILTYSLNGGPASATIGPDTGLFTWTPTEAQGPGTYSFDVVVTDDGTPTMNDFETISVTVNEVNAAPVLNAVSNKTVPAQSLLTFTASASDSDLPANTLTFSISGLPGGASINPNTGVFTWTPAVSQMGSYNATLKVNDGTAEVTRNFTISVTNINNPPVFTGTPAITGTAKAGSTLGLTDTGTNDDDGDTVTLSYQWKVNGVDIPGATSASFNVTNTEKGKTVSCSISADDGRGGTATHTTSGIPIYKFPWVMFIRTLP